MPITKTLGALRIALAKQAGIDTDDVGGTVPRHPTAWVNQVINDSFRSLRSFVVSKRYTLYKVATTAASLPTTPPVTGETYAEIPWPSTATDILGVDVLISGDNGRRPLEPVEWDERRNFDPSPLYMSGVFAPYAFSPVSQGSVSTTVFTAGTIALFPLPRGGSYKVWYLPEHTDVTADANLFPFGKEDWAQWLIWEGTRRIAARDNASNARLGEAARQLDPMAPDTVASRIAKSAPRHVRAGPQTVTRAWNYRHGTTSTERLRLLGHASG